MIIVETISEIIRIKNHTLDEVMHLLAECGLSETEIVSITEVN